MYKDKYIKYKKKYINLKMNQNGGGYHLDKITDKEKVKKIIPDISDKKMDLYPNTEYYFYYSDNDLIGYAFLQQPGPGIHPVLEEPMNGRIQVWGVEILEKYRGQGYGYKMLSQILDNDHEYFLRVQKDNIAAVKLYQKLGFIFYKENIIIGPKNEKIVRDIMIRKKLNQNGGNRKIIFLDGTSSSGKSTIAKLFEKEGYKHINVDDFMDQGRIIMLKNLPNEYTSNSQKISLHKYETGKLMLEESKKYDKVILDDVRQDILQFFNRKDIYIIIVYTSLDNLMRNFLKRRFYEPRGLFVFEQYSKRYISINSSIDSLDIISRPKFIELLKQIKYEFESETQLIEFANKIFATMNINDDLEHYIKLRDTYQYDYIVNTSNKSPSEIYQELIKNIK